MSITLTKTPPAIKKTTNSIQDFQEMGFREFRQLYSGEQSRSSWNDVYTGSNEKGYGEACRQVQNKHGILLGVVGGIDPVFSLIASQKPDLALLNDINPDSVDYLYYRGMLTQVCCTPCEYVSRVLGVPLDEKEFNKMSYNELRDAVIYARSATTTIAEEDEPMLSKIKELNAETLEKLKSVTPDEQHKLIERVFKEHGPSKIEPTGFLISALDERVNQNKGWLMSQQSYDSVKGAWAQGKIKAFEGDFMEQSFKVARYVLSKTDAQKVSSVYFSNILDAQAEIPTFWMRNMRLSRICDNNTKIVYSSVKNSGSVLIPTYVIDYEHLTRGGRFKVAD